MDVNDQASVDAAIAQIEVAHDGIDVLIHNAGHMVTGPAEAFTPEQLVELYNVNVLSTHRVNRAALPRMRHRGHSLVLWVSSTSVKGGTPPYLAPYFAAKAGMDSLAVSYAAELARWGSRPRSSCQARSPTAPTTSLTRGVRRMPQSRPSTRPAIRA